jgi:hypothetical protein
MKWAHMYSLFKHIMYIQNISVTTGIFEDLRCKKMSRAG